MQRGIPYFLGFVFIVASYFSSFGAKQVTDTVKNILYINSYHVGYSWGDSVASGILEHFKMSNKYRLYVEYLDSKRFGSDKFLNEYHYLKRKYAFVQFDGVILSDNAAIDFMMEYGDSLAPDIPVVFCGINNPDSYNFENSRYYGIKEGVDFDSVAQFVIKVIPTVKRLYFLGDNTSTSIINLNYVKSIEAKYKNMVEFEYISNISIDSLYRLAPMLDENGAVAMVNIFQDIDKTPINSDVFLETFASLSAAPVFADSETAFGHGIVGGIINSGAKQGKDVAQLAIKLISNKNFNPVERVKKQNDNAYYDYAVAKKFKLDVSLIPSGSIIINKPQSAFMKYLQYIAMVVFLIALLLTIILVLSLNIKRRVKAEAEIVQNLKEIKEKSNKLEEVYAQVNDANAKLEETNDALVESNMMLEKAREEAELSNKLKSSFLANLSHEIRTPLNAIVGFSSLINDLTFSVPEREKFVEMIMSNSDHLLDLINEILDFSQIEAGTVTLNKSKVPIKKLFDDIADSFYCKHLQHVEYCINMNNLDDNMQIYTDVVRFRQILSNLYSNAVKFTKFGNVELGGKIQDKQIIFYVKDTGIGISETDKDKVFERFYKSDDGVAEFETGTGIGLAISNKLAGLLGGQLRVSSKKGEGSTFYLSLPQLLNK